MPNQNTQKILRILLLVLAMLGIWYWFNNNQNQTIKSQADYIDVVRPWLRSIENNYQSSDITRVRDQLLYLNSREKSVGDGHLNLFLGFDAWQQYLETSNPVLQEQAATFFDRAAGFLPPLHNDIKRLKGVLLGNA